MAYHPSRKGFQPSATGFFSTWIFSCPLQSLWIGMDSPLFQSTPLDPTWYPGLLFVQCVHTLPPGSPSLAVSSQTDYCSITPLVFKWLQYSLIMVPKHKSSRCRHFYYRTSFCIIVINSLLCLTHKSDIILGMCRKDTQSVWAGTVCVAGVWNDISCRWGWLW